jgi:predicted lipid-binding transport protein (Tim44 family)
MSEGFAYLDILIFAMVAAFIAFKLRSVLGRRTGQERQRPTPISAPRPAEARVESTLPRADTVPAPSAEEPPVADIKDPALKAGLTQVRLADPQFALPGFLEGARGAFAMIVEAFAKGDKEALKPLLASDVFANFAGAIDERGRAGRTLATELVAVSSAELAGAEMRGSAARLTVRVVSDQINVTRDTSGEIVEGDPSAIHEVIDLWTFERDTRSRDPNWVLVETRSPEA